MYQIDLGLDEESKMKGLKQVVGDNTIKEK